MSDENKPKPAIADPDARWISRLAAAMTDLCSQQRNLQARALAMMEIARLVGQQPTLLMHANRMAGKASSNELAPAAPFDVPGYEHLAEVLSKAYDQAARGKGKERHANNLPFHEQRMQGISTLLNSPDGMAYQVLKKVAEGLQFEDPAHREKELLGAMVYLAGMIIWLRSHE